MQSPAARRPYLRLPALALALILAACAAPSAPAAPTAPATPVGPPARPETPGRGAAVPWFEYEAEAQADADPTNLRGELIGDQAGMSREFGEIPSEASGRRAVQLNAEGDYIRFQSAARANSIVVRFAIPDAPAGGGITATLSLFVNGEPWRVTGAPWDFAATAGKLQLTSRYAWVYGGRTQSLNTPESGGAHKFFDEARALVEPIPAGATVELRMGSGDDAAFYVIDLIDLEDVAAPLPRPESSLSIVEDCGATPNDDTNDGPAIQECIGKARAAGQSVWIPPGLFQSTAPLPSEQGIQVAEVSVQGAGMWHSTIQGAWARFHCTGSNCRFADFAILGETTTRVDTNPENGFNGAAGSGSRMERVWVEHTKVGWWVGAGSQNLTDGLVITGSRFRNLFADGVNLCNGASHSVVEQSHFRNTGDDAIATWAPSFDGPVSVGNTFRFNTVQVPWRANCFALYGGQDHTIEDNLCADTVMYPGLLIAQEFQAHPFGGTITVQRNTLLRAGGRMWPEPNHPDQHGALKVDARQQPIKATLVFRDISIERPTYAGIQVQGPFDIGPTTFEQIAIIGPGTNGMLIAQNSGGRATLVGVTVSSPGSDALLNGSTRYKLTLGEGNSGW
jgi:hypothetical protein